MTLEYKLRVQCRGKHNTGGRFLILMSTTVFVTDAIVVPMRAQVQTGLSASLIKIDVT